MRRSLVAAGAAIAVLAVGAGTYATAYAAEDEALQLAEPTGPHPVGTTTFGLTDTERPDPWVPDEDRQLMTSVWYPAADTDGEAAPYMTPEESELFVEQLEVDVPGDIFSTVETNAHVDAEPLDSADSQPALLLSPGFSFPRATLTGLAEDLASKGYVVAVMGHAYEAPITFPDGTTECVACDEPDMSKVVPGRVADTGFLLDSLTGSDAAWSGATMIDDARIAMGGHSIGGASSFATMDSDDRIAAGFNLDGTFYAPEDENYTVDRPFMMIGAEEHGQPGEDETWDKAWQNMSDWKRWMSAEGTNHSSLTDLSLLQEQAGMPGQDVPGERCTELARDFVTAFLDTHLRDEPNPILDGPTEDNPEMQFHNP